MLREVIFGVLAMYLAAAAGGFIRAGGFSKFNFIPRLRDTSFKWRGMWAGPGKVLSLVGWLLIAWGCVLFSFAMFLFLSPLLVLSFMNHLMGGRMAYGTLVQWYERLAERRWKN